MPSDLFDYAAAQAAKQSAVEQVAANADEHWYANTLAVVKRLAERMATLTTDDVWALVPATREGRAMGAVMTDARKRGWIVPTGDYVPSARVACHGRPVRRWRSLVYGQAEGR